MHPQVVESIHEVSENQCKHCSEPIITPFSNENGDIFCCSGCQQVHAIISGNKLEHFYSIQEQTQSFTKSQKNRSHQEFKHLDSEECKKQYVHHISQDESTISFFIEGIHCIACIWLVEHLPELSDHVYSSRLDIEKSIVTVHFSPLTAPSFIAGSLFKLGYRPFPIESLNDAKKLQKQEERKDLIRIGVALACSMNIMLYSLGIYAGAEGNYANLFNKLSLVLSLPIITFCSFPFFQSAWSSLKAKQINLDVPLSFSIITGFILSTYYVITGSDIHYFDSLSVLVFLLPLSRYILKKVHQGHLTTSGLSQLLVSGLAQRKNADGSLSQVKPQEIKKDEIVYIAPGEQIAIDGLVYKGKSKVDSSLLTGESQLLSVKEGDLVYHGYINKDEEILVQCSVPFSESKLSHMINEAEKASSSKPQLIQLTDYLSRFFIFIILITFIAALAYLSLNHGIDVALRRSLALVIIACPCALGLATPLAFSRGLKLASQRGIIIKEEKTLESLSHIDQIFFDKTGTLTEGSFQVSHIEKYQDPKVHYSCEDIIFSLEKYAQHPIAKSIVHYLSEGEIPLQNIEWDSTPTQTRYGITSHIDKLFYTIETIESHSNYYKVVLREDDQVLATLTLKDNLRGDTESLTNWLSYQEYKLHILSGDFSQRLYSICEPIKHYFTNILGGLSPQDKAEIITQSQNERESSLMIGDGANDSLAFTKASVSVAVNGSLESSIKISDVYLTKRGLRPIKEMLLIANGTLTTVRRNLLLSLLYNTLGATFALTGHIGPLEAAIIMPISSLTVLASTLIGTKDLRKIQGGT